MSTRSTTVSELVRLSGRFKGYASGWSDAAVRRYARDAGPLLGRLNQLVRSDCTTRNLQKEADLHSQIDDLEGRISVLAEAERKAAERPQIGGDAVMAHLGLPPGPDVGRALAWLLELKRSEGSFPSTSCWLGWTAGGPRIASNPVASFSVQDPLAESNVVRRCRDLSGRIPVD